MAKISTKQTKPKTHNAKSVKRGPRDKRVKTYKGQGR